MVAGRFIRMSLLLGLAVILSAGWSDVLAQSAGRVLDLPETPFNYANPELPDHFDSRHVRRLDNTPDDNPVTDHGATLGRVLFYDTKLSANNKTACASCHLQEHAFAEPKKVSVGFEGKKVDRNAMGLVNARYYRSGRFFWDERARTLEDQVLMPIENRIEMGHKLDDLVAALGNDPMYGPLFEKAFGDNKVTQDRMSKALAQFVRSLVSYRSRYDDGIAQAESISEDFHNFTDLENEGKRIFLGRGTRAECASCHMPNRRGRDGQQRAVFFLDDTRNNGLDGDFKVKDGGVGDITMRASEIGDFKSPSLRNVELTGPYMHDGRLATLEDVVNHYDSGVQPHQNLSRRLRGRGRGRGRDRDRDRGERGGTRLNLSERQKSALVAFLKTLTDRKFVTDKKFSNPFTQGDSTQVISSASE